MARNTTDYIMSWVYGILGLILIIFLINVLSYFLQNSFTSDLVRFLNSNIILLIVISFLFFMGGFFYSMDFPGNLAFPLFDAFGGAFLVYFIINLIVLIDKYVNTGIGNAIQTYATIFSTIIFFIIIIFGYLSVISRSSRKYYRDEIEEEIIEEPIHSRHVRKRVIRKRIRK